MKASLYYRYSKLDKEHQFGLVADNVWIWFYLGQNMKGIKFTLYPYQCSWHPDWKLLKEYNYNGAHEIADWIARRIKSKLKSK